MKSFLRDELGNNRGYIGDPTNMVDDNGNALYVGDTCAYVYMRGESRAPATTVVLRDNKNSQKTTAYLYGNSIRKSYNDDDWVGFDGYFEENKDEQDITGIVYDWKFEIMPTEVSYWQVVKMKDWSTLTTGEFLPLEEYYTGTKPLGVTVWEEV